MLLTGTMHGKTRQLRAALESHLGLCLLRIFNLANRNRLQTKAYGSFDRTWWAWRMKDMPNASVQYAVYPLALGYRFFGRPMGGNDQVRAAIGAGLEFWCQQQHANGAVDQLMPYEYSVGTTFYTMSAVIETQRLMGEALPPVLTRRLDHAIELAGGFLLRHEERYGFIANHVALFAWVFGLLHQRTGDEKYRISMQRCLDQLVQHYDSDEGWFLEYEGADPGYQTQCLHYLALICRRWEMPELAAMLKASLTRFMVYFFHPHGTFGGGYGSRSTEIIYPGAFFYFADRFTEARAATRWLAAAIVQERIVLPLGLDDENVIRLTAAYLHTFFEQEWTLAETDPDVLPANKPRVTHSFPNAGIEIRGRDRYYCIVNSKKGGALMAIGRHQAQRWEDIGYAVVLESGKVFSSHAMQPSRSTATDGTLHIQARFFEVPGQVLTPWRQMLLRLLNFTLLRLKPLRDGFKSLLVRVLITDKRPATIALERSITWTPDSITIDDTIHNPRREPVARLVGHGGMPLSSMASAGYACAGNLGDGLPQTIDPDELNRTGRIHLTRTLRFQ